MAWRARARWWLALVLVMAGSSRLAAEPPAVAAQPVEDLSRLYGEARALREEGDPKGAIEKLNKLLAAKPDSYESWWLLAWLYDSQGRQKDALPAWRKAAELLPAEDDRRAEAARHAALVAHAIEGRVRPRPYHPPSSGLVWWLPSGPSLALLLVLLGVCGGGWLRVWREDGAFGAASAEGRRVALGRRLRAGEAAARSDLLARLAAGQMDADERLMLAAVATDDEAVRAELARSLAADGPVRGQAAAVPAGQREQIDEQAWLTMLTSADATVREAALGAAPKPLPEAAAERLKALALADDDQAERAAALLSGLASARLALVEVALDAARGEARATAMASLLDCLTLPAEAARPLAKRLADVHAADRPQLAALLAKTGRAAAAVLVRASVDLDPEVRAAAGDELRLRPEFRPLPEAARELLAKAAAAKRPRLSAELLAVAADTDPVLAEPLLRGAVDSKHWPLRHAAVELSPLLPPDAATPLLRRALERLGQDPPDAPEATEHWRRLVDSLDERPLPELLPALLQSATQRPDLTGLQPLLQRLLGAPEAQAVMVEAGPSLPPEALDLAARLSGR